MLELNWQIIWNFVNIGILYFILKKFLFGPVTKIMDQREKLILSSIEDAKTKVIDADAKKAEYEAILSSAGNEARGIIEDASVQAKSASNDIIKDAKKEADQIIKAARDTARFESDTAVRGIHDDIAKLAVLAASKVMEKNIDESSNKGIVDDFLKEVGAA